jgi:hypothetical protein
MLELICDQTYTWEGLPVDRSPYENHGNAINTDGSFDGQEPGSGVIKFPHPDSRVLIAPGIAWNPMTAMKIEVLAKVDPMARRNSILVAGQGSFSFGILEGALEAGFVNATNRNNYVRADSSFSPDNKFHPIPANKWVKLGFHHDGFAKMRLFLDDELVGEAIIEGSIPPVQSPGVSIGNGTNTNVGGLQFPGDIDEVRIWRLDPKAIKREFLGRPYTKETAECWQRHFEKIIHAVEENPEQLRALAEMIKNEQYSFLRSLFLLPDSDQAKLRAILYEYGELWFAGDIAGPEMEKVLCDWIATLRSLDIDPGGGPGQDALADALAQINIDSYGLLKCDPEIAGFLELMKSAVDKCGKKEGFYAH